MFKDLQTGSWDTVNARARKVDRRREKRHQRNTNSATTNLRQDRRRDIRYVSTFVEDQHPFLYEKVLQIAENTLDWRKKINRRRRREARKSLSTRPVMQLARFKTQGACIKIRSERFEDFYLPIREIDCLWFDAWRWVTKLDDWDLDNLQTLALTFKSFMTEQAPAFAVVSEDALYHDVDGQDIKRLFRYGGVTTEVEGVGVLLIQFNRVTYSIEVLEGRLIAFNTDEEDTALDEAA